MEKNIQINNGFITSYLQLLAYVNDNTLIKSQIGPDVTTLYNASLNYIIENCCTEITKSAIRDNKKNYLNNLKIEIENLKKSLIDKSLALAAHNYRSDIEIKKAELKKTYEIIENIDEKTVIEQVVRTILSNYDAMQETKQLANEIRKKSLADIQFNNQPCVENDELNQDTINDICDYLINNGLVEIIERVYNAIEIDEQAHNLQKLIENSDKYITYVIMEMYKQKIEEIKKQICTDLKIDCSNFDLQSLINECNKKFFSKLRSNKQYIKGQCESIIDYSNKITELEKKCNRFEPNNKLLEIFKNTKAYKMLKNMKNTANFENESQSVKVKLEEEIRESINQIKETINSKTDVTDDEKRVINNFARALNLSVQATKELLMDENVYASIITSAISANIVDNITLETAPIVLGYLDTNGQKIYDINNQTRNRLENSIPGIPVKKNLPDNVKPNTTPTYQKKHIHRKH